MSRAFVYASLVATFAIVIPAYHDVSGSGAMHQRLSESCTNAVSRSEPEGIANRIIK